MKDSLRSIFVKNYDFFEKLAWNSSRCHNYMNKSSLASFTFLTGRIDGIEIVFESTCYVDDGCTPLDGYYVDGGDYNPSDYIRCVITTQGIYQFNAVYNNNQFTPWSEFDVYEFRYEYLVGNANNIYTNQCKRLFRELKEVEKTIEVIKIFKTMNTECPKCGSEDAFFNGECYVCPCCDYEWEADNCELEECEYYLLTNRIT